MIEQQGSQAERNDSGDGSMTEDRPRAADDLSGLRQELEEAKDRALRSQAELDNVRKRLRREMDEERKFACLPLLRDLLPVVDNVARAIQAAEKSPEVAAVVEGVRLVAQQLEQVFSQYQCKKIVALQQPFDPHVHAAISQQPSTDFPPNTVLLVVQDGYQLYDRVLRPSQVIVSTSATTS